MALVTGASSGIGEAFARRLAERRTDLVLVARSGSALERLAAELAESHGVRVEVLVADLTEPAARRRVEDRLLDGDPIDLLVNNAGFGLRAPFWELDLDRQQAEIDLNITALVRLSHAAVRRMVPAGRGAVINISSVAGQVSISRMSVYCATKAFVTRFTETLHEELAGTGVTATVVLPGMTRTNFSATAGTERSERRMPGPFFQEADDVAVEGLQAAAGGRVLCITGAPNRALFGLLASLPRGLQRRLVGGVTRRA